MALESVFRDVATIVSEKCVNPASNRPYTVRDGGLRERGRERERDHLVSFKDKVGARDTRRVAPEGLEERIGY